LDINRINTRLIPISFDYAEPRTLDEALQMLEGFGGRAVALAGGTDLLVKMKQRSAEPKVILNIKRIPSLSYIRDGTRSMRIGPTTRMGDIERSPAVARRFPVLAEAASVIGSVQVRNMATIGGNLCNASPAADGSLVLLALDSSVKLTGSEGSREMPLSSFFLGPGRTALGPRELLTEITVPHLPEGTGMAFSRVTRTDMDLAKVNVAVVLHVRSGGVTLARIALGAVAPTPMRAIKAEGQLAGSRLTRSLIEEAAATAAGEARPISDIRSSAEYRKEVTAVLVRRTLALAWKRAGGSD